MNTSDIVRLRVALVAEGATRHEKYDYIMDAIGGDYETRRLQGLWERFQQFTGLDQKMPLDRETFEFRLNLIPSVIRASRSFLATVPTLRCPPSKPEEAESRAQAEKLERVYQGFWQYSHIGKRLNQLGYWNPTLGTTIGVVWPDIENKRPTLQMRSPYGFYPVLRDVDGYNLKCAIFHSRYTRRQCRAMYPGLPSSFKESDDLCNVDEYYDDKEIVTIVADEHRVKEIKNMWGFVAMAIIPNETFGEGPWGDGDVEWVIPLQAEHNYRETIKNATLSLSQMQPLAIEDGDNLPEDIPMGPLDGIPVNPGGKVYRVSPPQVPYQMMQAQTDLLKLIDRVGQVPSVMRSEFSGNAATGKAISALLGPTQMAYNVKGNEIYPALAELNKMAMKMWLKMWGKEEHTVYSLDTTKNNKMSVETFSPEEFDPWFENIVFVDSSSYFDAQSRFIINLQAVQNRLKSRQTASAETPGVDDAELEQKLIKQELAEDMQMQQGGPQSQITQANEAFAEANVQPDMAAQGATNANATKGYIGEMPVAQTTGGFESGAAPELPPEAPEQEGTLLSDLIEFFGEIPKLKGKVWLAGGVVSDPSYAVGSPTYVGIEVFLEKMSDKSAINQKMRDEYPEVWGNLVYHEGEPGPDEPSILVFDPEGPTDEDMPPDLMDEEMGGMPPEMAGAPAMGAMPPEMGGVV